MKFDYATLLSKVVQARLTVTLSDNHEEVMQAIKARRGYEMIAKESGFDMERFNEFSRDRYLEIVLT